MAGRYHVFLSHSSADKPAVEELALRLKKEGIEPWLDRWHLVPGAPWMRALEEALDASDSCAVFVGPGGLGPWQDEEVRAAIDRRVRESKESFRVIPVLLPGAERGQRSRLPAFLVASTWVEFRHSLDEAEPFRRLVCGIRGVEPGAGPGESLYEGQCPYRGLQVFDVEHAPFFCGHEALTEWLLSELRAMEHPGGRARFLAIVGSSGSGKSSLARAGLVASLRRGALEGSDQWPVAICRPGPDPLESLAVALSGSLAVGQGPSAVLDLIASLRKNANTLHLTTRLALESTPQRRLVLLVDQFEELFTLCPGEEMRQALIANLLQAARVPQGQTLVLLTMRADFYGKCAAYPELAAAVSDHHFLVGPMTEAELRRAIERPAQLVGCELEPGLVDMLVQDVNNQPGALPLLQHALLELWGRCRGRRLTVSAYKEIGKLEGALDKRANVLLYNFAEPERELCRRIFLRLTQPGEGTEDTKRRVPFRELLPSAKDEDRVQGVVHTLADARLITTEGAHLQQEVFVEVAHEALIRSWSKLREWVEADRAGMRTLRRLTEAANQWQEQGRDDSFLYRGARLAAAREWAALHPGELSPLEGEFLQASSRRSRRRQLNVFAAVVLVIAALGGLTVYSWVQQDRARQSAHDFLIEKERAEENEKTAERRKKRAEEKEELAEQRKQEAERQTRIATAQRLAAQAGGVGGMYPQRAVLLAAEAVQVSLRAKESPVPLAQQALQQALGGIGGRPLCGHGGSISSLAFSRDGRWLATGSDDKTARLWDLRAKDPAASPIVLCGHGGSISSLAFSPEGRWLATGSWDKTARLWDLRAKDPAASPIVLRGHKGWITALAFSPDGRRLATGSDDGVRLWDLRAKDPATSPIILRGHGGSIECLGFSPDGRRLATGSDDKTARLWDLTARDPAASPAVLRGHQALISVLAFSPDGRRLATGSTDDTARLWDLTAKNPAARPLVLRGHRGSIRALAFSPDGRRLATGSDDKTARLWDLTARDPAASPAVLRGHQALISVLAFSPDGRRLATGSFDHGVRLWDVTAKDPALSPIILRGHENLLECLAFSPDGRWLATGSYDKTARLWDVTRQDLAASPVVLRGHTNSIYGLAFSPDGRRLITSSNDSTARLWDLTASDPAASPVVLHAQPKGLAVLIPKLQLALSRDGRWLATCSKDSTVRLWDLTARDPAASPAILRGNSGWFNPLAFSPDGRRLATSSYDKTALVWGVTAKNPAASPVVLRGHTGELIALAFSPDGRWLASGSFDHTARLWDLTARDPAASPAVLRGHTDSINAVAFSPDGRWLATASLDRTARLWDVTTKDPAASPIILRGHTARIDVLAFSPDGRRLATGSGDYTARLWDVTAKDPAASPAVLRGHTEMISALAFSPDGLLATGSTDKTARLWDLRARDPATSSVVLAGHEGTILALAFSPDGRRLATGSFDDTARLWHVRTDDLLKLASATVQRNMTRAEWDEYFRGQPYRKTFPDLPGPGDRK